MTGIAVDRIQLTERADWRQKAEAAGFRFHTMHGEPYWDETSAYRFTLEEIETGIEDPATELHAMCREAVAAICGSEDLLTRLGIPPAHMDLVAQSWAAQEPELYGRFDLAYDGNGPAKLLEYNADTPTSLYEAATFQWDWLTDRIEAGTLPEDADQFNRIHEALTERFAEIFPPKADIHFASVAGSDEDYGTVECMAWAANAAGMIPHYTPLGEIGLTDRGQFADNEQRVIGALFKLYPWEDMLRDDFAPHLGPSGCRFLEPAWKAVVSNKGLLPVLWRMFEGHPNLLPAFFRDEVGGDDPLWLRAAEVLERGHVEKPIFSREGASISIVEAGQVTERAENRAYDGHPAIVQAYQPLPVFDGWRPVLGAWVVGQTCVGLGLREDRGRITQDLSRFKPHLIHG